MRHQSTGLALDLLGNADVEGHSALSTLHATLGGVAAGVDRDSTGRLKLTSSIQCMSRLRTVVRMHSEFPAVTHTILRDFKEPQRSRPRVLIPRSQRTLAHFSV